jgi:hypothetical protein
MLAKNRIGNEAELALTGSERVLHGLLKPAGGALDPDTLAKVITKNAERAGVEEFLALALPPAPRGARGKGVPRAMDPERLVAELKKLAKTPGGLQEFALALSEAVFLGGTAKPARVLDATYDLLRTVGKELLELRSLPNKRKAPGSSDKLDALRRIDRELMQYVQTHEGIKSDDYSVLNQQHRVIAAAIKAEEQGFIAKLPKPILSKLESLGPVLASEIPSWGERAQSEIQRLIALGIVHQSEVQGVGNVIAFARAKTTTAQFEATIPPRVRERMGEELKAELRLKYSGKLRPLGIAENREGGVPTLNDRLRLKKVAEKVGVGVAHMVLALKYLEEHKLVVAEHTGYRISPLAERVGLGMRAVRIVQRAAQHGGVGTDKVSLERYLDAVKSVRETWKVPTYKLSTKEGGAPWIYLLDELCAGNARIDADHLKGVLADIRANPNALVIASNMIQGDPAVDPRAMRTSLTPASTGGVDLRDYDSQLKLVRSLLSSLGHPVLQLQGKAELETANIRADVQRVRDQYALQGSEKPDEAKVKAALSRLNDISYRAGRKFNAKLHAEILEFVSQVVMPLEAKLGRQLLESSAIQEKTGLDMNELEIVRDIASELMRDHHSGRTEGRDRLQALYTEFFDMDEVGPDYLLQLEEVLFPVKEALEAGAPVVRGGAAVEFITPQARSGLTMMCLPEFKFGVAEAQNPTAKLIELIKSRTLGGRTMPDIVVTGATGQAYLSMTAGGTLIVSAASLQASNYDDTYFHTEAPDRHKRRRAISGGESSSGSIAFSGGVHEGIKTDAYTLRLWNRKIREVLEENARLGRPSKQVDIFSTSDWQVGSPTAKPATMLRGLFWAIANGQKEIVINGDAFQGQNYGRAPAEMQLTGLVGIEDQQAFVYALLNPLLDCIRRMREADPSFEIPKFKILAGNHETNSQSGKGLQGIWFLQTIAAQVQSFYRGAFGKEIADTHVLYPKKFVDRMGVDVDYSHMVLDHTETTGFRIGVQHYVGVGAKGSSSVPPISAAKGWARSMENELRPLHGFLLGHWHTQSVTMGDGLFYAIFGANADKSGFEWHLGYPTTVPAAGVLRLFSDRPPEMFFVTDPYLRLQEPQLQQLPEYRALVEKWGSLEGFVENERGRHQRRDQGAMRYSELKLGGATHGFIEPHRKVG